MAPKVDPDIVHGQLRQELTQADQGLIAATAINGLLALVLWLVGFSAGIVVGSFFSFGWGMGFVVLLAMAVATGFCGQRARKERALDIEKMAAGVPPGGEAGTDGAEADPLRRMLDRSIMLPAGLTVQALAAWQRRTPPSDERVDQAVAVLVALLKVPAWIAATRLEVAVEPQPRAEAIRWLMDLNLVWRRVGNERIELRINPLFRKACGVLAPNSDEAAAEELATARLAPGAPPQTQKSTAPAAPDFKIGQAADPLAATRQAGKPPPPASDTLDASL